MIAKGKKQLIKKMNLGILFLLVNATGSITLSELDWLQIINQNFQGYMALLLKIGRLMDEGIIELDCKLPA